MSLLSYSYCITGISKPADTEFINLKLIMRGGYVERVTPIFGRTDINTLPLSDTHEKSLCF